jgi:hypothetical protein
MVAARSSRRIGGTSLYALQSARGPSASAARGYVDDERSSICESLAGDWEESITFGTGPGTESTGFVEDVRFSAVDGKTLYTISYSSPDGPGRLSFYFGDDGGRTIRLRNQEQIVWKKSD